MGPMGLAKRQKSEEAIIFFKEDAKGFQFLHNDAMAVSLNIVNYNVHRILIDNESLIDILFYDAFSKMDIFLDRLGRLDSSLVGFIGDTTLVEGVINLPVITG